MVLNIFILFFIIIGLVIHRYLTTFWERGTLEYSNAFLFFVNIFILTYIVNFIYMFGFMWGVILTLLTFFQVLHVSYLWIFLTFDLIKTIQTKSLEEAIFRLTNPNKFVYNSFVWITVCICLLTIINFFVSDYASIRELLTEHFKNNYYTPIIWIVVSAVISNIIRVFAMSVLDKKLKQKTEI